MSPIRRVAPPLLVAGWVLLAAHFFETFPNGWDQAEYAWCVKDGYLPHSPYVLFILLGRIVHLALPAATALSTISLVAGLGALLLIRELVDRLGGSRGLGWAAALLLAGTTVFVRHAVTQEVYALQLALLLATAVLLATPTGRHRIGWAGLAFGAAFTSHNASVFVLPALAVLLWRPWSVPVVPVDDPGATATTRQPGDFQPANYQPVRFDRSQVDVTPGDVFLIDQVPVRLLHRQSVDHTQWVDEINNVRIELTVPKEEYYIVPVKIE